MKTVRPIGALGLVLAVTTASGCFGGKDQPCHPILGCQQGLTCYQDTCRTTESIEQDRCLGVTCNVTGTSCALVNDQARCALHRDIDVNRAADILFVIDNSGSMAEEQENLARNASSIGANAPFCNQVGFDTLRPFVAANRETPQEEWPANMQQIYNDCGFIERLLLFDNKFHIGVVTTDSGDCDRPYNNPSRGSEPQRGCLHTSPTDPSLSVLTWSTPNLPQKFYNIVHNLLTYGNAYEKGLWAVENFLTPGHSVPAASACDIQRDCSGDYAAFWRDQEANARGDLVETKLVIVTMTDEEDCSHGPELDENVSGNTDLCYTRPELLTPTDHFVQFINGLKPRADLVAFGLIAGLHDPGNGLQPGRCQYNGGTITGDCTAPRGNSVATCTNCVNDQPICMCHPVAVTCGSQTFEAANCCTADSAARYYAVATQMNSFKVDSICSPNYKETMIAIANLVNEPTSIVLPVQPAGQTSLLVQIKGARWNDQWVDMPYCGADCGDGWNLVDAIGNVVVDNTGERIKFHGSWLPEPGDEIRVAL